MRLTWLGHATVLIETAGGTRLLTDPVLRSRVAHLKRHAPPVDPAQLGRLDAVLLSHVHHDHLDRPTLRALGSPTTAIVLPRGAQGLVGDLAFAPVVPTTAGERTRVGGAPSSRPPAAGARPEGGREPAGGTQPSASGGADVLAVPAWHPARRWPRSPELESLGYLVERVWFAGDTDLDPRMAELRGAVDVALVPVWGWGPSLGPGHLDPQRAAEAVALVQPRIAIPIHWGTYLPYGLQRRHGGLLSTPAPDFAAHVARLAPDVRVELLAPGASLSV